MTDPLFRELQERLDMYSIGFPKSESGLDIKILEKLFTIDEARIFMAMSPQLETPEALARRIGMTADEAGKKLGDMAAKGLVFSLKKNGRVRYGAIAFVHGLFEFQVKHLDRELAELVRRYMGETFKDAMAASAADFLRVVPIGKSVTVTQEIAAYDDAAHLLSGADPIVVTECMCRKSSAMVDHGCGKPLEVCFMFGSMGRYYLDHGMGRQVDLNEALEILAMAHEQGLITQPATAQNPSGMCNCCGDCCGPLTSLKRHPRPAEMVFSNHFAVIDSTRCTGCETCVDRCQMDAVTMDDAGLAAISLARCIGCGLCVTTCPTEAVSLERKAYGQYRVPPETTMDQMLAMARNRGVL